jgi:hypothetical protein
MILNQKLLIKQNVTDEQQDRLYVLYAELVDLFDRARDVDSDEQAKTLVLELQDLEFKLQENWNFSRDVNFHSYWFKIPGCSCPKLDNAEMIGIDRRIVNHDCRFHGTTI